MKPSGGQGTVPKGWRLVRLGDVVQFRQGGTPSKSRLDYWDGDIPFVTGADLRESYIGRDAARSFLTQKGLDSGATAICEEGGLLLATRTRVGLVAIAEELMGASQDITLLLPTEAAYGPYLCRTLVKSARLLQKRSRGTTIQGISREDVDALPTLLPPLPEQRAIAAVLDSIDDAIERTDAVIAAMEQLRDSLLHQLLTRGFPGWHTEWKEAPGLGTIPADWEVVRLGEVATVERGKFAHRPRNEPRFYGGDIPFIQTGDVVKATGQILEHSQTLNELGLSISRLFPAGTIIITIAANIGETAIASYPVAFPDSLVGITPDAVDASFLEYFLRTRKAYLNELAPESAQKNINLEDLRPLLTPLPYPKEQQEIAATLNGVGAAVDGAQGELQGLRLLKESIADTLLTGRVRVGTVAEDAEGKG